MKIIHDDIHNAQELNLTELVNKYKRNDQDAEQKIEELMHWIIFEIKRSESYKKEITNVYDGIVVGFKAAPLLQDSHIRFCKTILRMIE